MEARPPCPLTTQEISDIIAQDSSSKLKIDARKGEKYYEGENDILNHRIFYFDGDGVLVEDKFASNIRVPHGFFKELVDQKVSYLINPLDRHVTSENEALDKELARYFDESFNLELLEACTDASKNGSGYLYAYTSASGEARFQHSSMLGTVEVRDSLTDADCDFMIYRYLDRIDRNQTEVERIVVWDANWMWYFIKTDKGIVLDESRLPDNPRAHMQWEDDSQEGTFYSGFGFIPFWRVDNNRNRQSDLKPVKAIIDDYDLMKCGLSNNLQDLTEGFFVVKGYNGDDGGLTEMITNFRKKRHIGVSEEGGVEIQTVQIPYEARKVNMEIDKENIYQFGMGLNTTGLKDTSATTNIAIKTAYALLDLKCNRFEMRLKAMMKKIASFVVDEINKRNNTAYTLDEVNIEFKREVMTNATDNAQIELTEAQTIQTQAATLLNVATIYGDEAVLEAVCALLDLDAEEVRASVQDQGSLNQAIGALTDGATDGDE